MRFVKPGNVKKALARIRRNKGTPGLDGMTVEELGACLKDRWLAIRFRHLDSTEEPKPVRRLDIPKGSSGFVLLAGQQCLTALSSRR